MERDEFYSALYLAHHGVKGQKWGVRRYQNEDGSLTPAGERRQQRQIRKDMRVMSKMSPQAIAANNAIRLKYGNEAANKHAKQEHNKQLIKTGLKLAVGAAAVAGAAYAGKKFYDAHPDAINKVVSKVKDKIELGKRKAALADYKEEIKNRTEWDGGEAFKKRFSEDAAAVEKTFRERMANTAPSKPSVSAPVDYKKVAATRTSWDGGSAFRQSMANKSTSQTPQDYNAQIMETLNKMREMGRTGKKSK